MNQTIEAVYKDGGFELLEEIAIELEEGEHVTLIIKAAEHLEDSPMSLTEKYFKGLSEEDIDKVIAHALSRQT